MRRILMFMGIAILAFPLVAVGAVKVRTKVGGYKWDIPAGKRMVKGFKAPVKAGPFTLGFHTQIEMDFESNHQFDFSDETADGQSNNGVAGVNAARGLAVPGDIIKGDEFLSEFRFGMDAVAGPVTTHVVCEGGATVLDRGSENTAVSFERAWGDLDLGWFNVRYGTELYALEPTYMLYGDDDTMLSIYKNTGDFFWRVTYLKRVDGDEAVRGNIGARALAPGDNATGGGTGGGEGTNNDVDVVMVILEFPFANPVGKGTMSVSPFYVLDHDKRFKDTDTLAGTTSFDGTIVSHYLGATIVGNLGPLKAVISGAYNFGEDDTGFNALNSATGLPRNEVDISAWQAYVELASPVPGVPLTLSVTTYLASGDDDPFDDSANGCLGVVHNSEMFSGHDIFIDKSEDGGSLHLRLQSAAGVLNGGEAIALAGDDEAILQGLSSFNNVGGAGTAVHPTRLAGAAISTPGSNIATLDPYAVNNRSHPGIVMVGGALKYKLLKNATIMADYQHIRLMSPEGLSPLAAGRTTVGVLSKGGDIDGHFGDQFGVHFVWKPAKYVTIDPRFVVLIPGDAIDDLTGEDTTAWTFRLGMRWNF